MTFVLVEASEWGFYTIGRLFPGHWLKEDVCCEAASPSSPYEVVLPALTSVDDHRSKGLLLTAMGQLLKLLKKQDWIFLNMMEV